MDKACLCKITLNMSSFYDRVSQLNPTSEANSKFTFGLILHPLPIHPSLNHLRYNLIKPTRNQLGPSKVTLLMIKTNKKSIRTK